MTRGTSRLGVLDVDASGTTKMPTAIRCKTGFVESEFAALQQEMSKLETQTTRRDPHMMDVDRQLSDIAPQLSPVVRKFGDVFQAGVFRPFGSAVSRASSRARSRRVYFQSKGLAIAV